MKKILLMILGFCYSLTMVAQSTTTAPAFGKNIIAVSPIQVINSDLLDNNGSDVCVNLSYERIFSNEHFGFKLPVSISLKNPFVYIMPTLKLYPTKQGVVRYAVGPQFFFGTGTVKRIHEYYDYYNGYTYYYNDTLKESRTQFGFMINNSINFTIIKNLYLDMDLGLGINYYDTRDNTIDKNNNNNNGVNFNDNSPFNPIVQFNFSMGYRF